MKIPETPPNIDELMEKAFKSKNRNLLIRIPASPVDEKNRYLHWEDLKYRTHPEGLTSEEWWLKTKLARQGQSKQSNFKDKKGRLFTFTTPDTVLEELHLLDQKAAGQIATGNLTPTSEYRNTYIVKSLINEAITSSQIEGATTTRKVAKEMLSMGREPRDKSEQMIYNNYRAMQFIRSRKEDPLTPAIIFELHEILTVKTMDNPDAAGKLRKSDDIQVVDDRDETVLHTPPKASELPDRMKLLCKFANEKKSSYFIHPIIRAIILHFMLAYDHPFEDGNGRTARAIFYWSAINSGYWLMEYISISEIIKNGLIKYGKAFLETETDENDLTYFIIHQIGVIKSAINKLTADLEKKKMEATQTLEMLSKTPKLKLKLNPRQLFLLKDALKKPGKEYTIQGHMTTHGTVYETARRDLLSMSEKLRLLDMYKYGKAMKFVAPDDLQKRIAKWKR
jgi:Fic family protein